VQFRPSGVRNQRPMVSGTEPRGLGNLKLPESVRMFGSC
jgi:hypothetical protein